MYQRIETTDGKTVMNKALYDNLQDGIDENKKSISDLSGNLKATNIPIEDTSNNFENDNIEGALQELIQKIATALINAHSYTDGKISALINGSPTTLDTLKELADAIGENEDLITALNSAIGNKADSGHTHGADKISIADTTGNYSSKDVEGALAEIPNQYLKLSGGQLNKGAFIDIVNGWFGVPLRLGLEGNTEPTYTDRAGITATDGNLHLDAMVNHTLCLNYYSGNTDILVGINRYILLHTGNYKNYCTAQNTPIADINGNYVSDNVEGALVEIGAGTTPVGSARALRTLSENNDYHVTNQWDILCQHNVDKDEMFKLYCRDKSYKVKTDYADNAGSVSASKTYLSDTADNYTSDNVEGALAEIANSFKLTTITKTLTITTEWQDTGISGSDLPTGTLAVQVSGFNSSTTSMWSEIFSGIMSWFGSNTNSPETDEILLHKAGHAPNGRHIYLRTVRHNNGILTLQIASNANLSASPVTFKFRKLI